METPWKINVPNEEMRLLMACEEALEKAGHKPFPAITEKSMSVAPDPSSEVE